MAQVTGAVLDSAREFVVSVSSETAWNDVLERLPEAQRRQVLTSVTVGWYDLQIYLDLLAAMDDSLHEGRPALLERYGSFAAEHDLNRLFRMLLRMANPAYVLERSAEYWARFHDSGRFEVRRISPTHAHLRITDWAAADTRACRVLRAYISRMIELVGAKSVVVHHTLCRATGAPACEFELHWR